MQAALVSANQDPRPETALEVPGDDDEIGDDPNDELGPAHEADPTMIPSDPDDMFQRCALFVFSASLSEFSSAICSMASLPSHYLFTGA